MQDYYMNSTVKLYDIVFLQLPALPDDFFAQLFAALPAAVGLLRYIFLPGPLSLRWTWFIRVIFAWSTLWYLRAVCILVTPLPPLSAQCTPKNSFPDNIWLEAYANLPGIFWYAELQCQDMLFSGHTTMGTIWTLFCWRYTRRSPWFRISVEVGRGAYTWWTLLADSLLWLWLLFGWYAIAASHFHYTVDVVVAVMLVFLVYNNYHSLIESLSVRRKYPFTSVFVPPIRWLEEHSVDLKLFREQSSFPSSTG